MTYFSETVAALCWELVDLIAVGKARLLDLQPVLVILYFALYVVPESVEGRLVVARLSTQPLLLLHMVEVLFSHVCW